MAAERNRPSGAASRDAWAFLNPRGGCSGYRWVSSRQRDGWNVKATAPFTPPMKRVGAHLRLTGICGRVAREAQAAQEVRSKS